MATVPPSEASRPVSPTPSQLPPVPGSPVYSVASTAHPISQFNLPLPPAPRPSHPVLSKADLERTQEAYSELVSSAKAYRLALATLSNAASAFGSALESCARLKEARAEPIGPAAGANMTASFTTKGACTADPLMSASGVHHLIANHQQILSETVYRSFEVPLLHDLDKWQTVIDEEEDTYQQRLKAQSKEVKRLEKQGLKLHKQQRRDVARFRAHLVELTNKLDGLTTLHADHARTMLRESQETSGRIVDASCSLVRAEVDIFEGLARKGWSGGGLDDLLEKGQDLFAADYDGNGSGAGGGANGDPTKLFSILPPKSILADSASEVSRAGHGRADSLLMDTDRYQSLTAVATEHRTAPDNESILSADFNKPRNARPFSPQPIRRRPTDVTFDSLGAVGEVVSHQGQSQGQGKGEDEGAKSPERPMSPIDDEGEPHDHQPTGEDGDDQRRGRRSPDSPREHRFSSEPELVTDESSPEAVWVADGQDEDK
jgi:hypothetical protein